MPRIVSRAEAGLAPPRSRIGSAPRRRAELFLHHDVLAVGHDAAADWRETQRAAFGRGFADVSYTFGAHPNGALLEGRAPDVVGAHTAGYNSTAHAIVLLGNYHAELANPPPLEPTPEQIEAVQWLRGWMVSAGLLTSAHRFRPHRSVVNTACPGSNAVRAWPRFSAPWQPPAPPPAPPAEPGTDWTEELLMALPTLSEARRAEQFGDPLRHQQVKNLQGLLQAANRPCAIDGDYGPGTTRALAEWQAATGLSADGVCGPQTWRTLLGA